MAKGKKSPTVVVKCECSTCGQIAHVVPGTLHHYCRGMRLVGPLPGLFSGLSKPDNKGTWRVWQAKPTFAHDVQTCEPQASDLPSSYAGETQGAS